MALDPRCVAAGKYPAAFSWEIDMNKAVLAGVVCAAFATGAMAQTAASRFITLQSGDMLSSNVTGLDVYDDGNHAIGKIQDVAFDSSKAMKGYILSVGGFLGVGKHYVAVDPEAVKVKWDDKDKKWHANMTATKDELKAAPQFKYEGAWNGSKS